MKPLNNWVLLKVKIHNDKMRLEGGKILWLDTSFEPEKHSSVVCEVVEVPDKLYYKKGDYASMPWKTEMELQKGDEVIIHYLAYQNAFGLDGHEGRVFEMDGDVCFFCKYESIFVAKNAQIDMDTMPFKFVNDGKDWTRDENWMAQNNIVVNHNTRGAYNVTVLNGYVLCEPVSKEVKTSLILPDYLKYKKQVDVAIVRYLGSCNQEYYYHPDRGADDDSLKSGDMVVLDKICDIPLEYAQHRTFNGDKEYYRVQRCDILAVIIND